MQGLAVARDLSGGMAFRFVPRVRDRDGFVVVDRLMGSILRMTQIAAALSGSIIILSSMGHPSGVVPENLVSLQMDLAREQESSIFKTFSEEYFSPFQLV